MISLRNLFKCCQIDIKQICTIIMEPKINSVSGFVTYSIVVKKACGFQH